MADTAQTNGEPRVLPRLRQQYDEVAVPALIEQFGYKNRMQVPKLEKVVINIGMGEAVGNAKALDNAVNDIQTITGQKPIITRAKRSIAQFKIRAGMPIGVKVTLRGARMYEFVDRLFNIAMPRVRDFRGVSPNAFDGRGNYTLGLREQLIFPEIEYDKIDRVRGMEITFSTTAQTDAEGRRLLELLGMPYTRPQATQRLAS
jgi:large subunit ribosomal protein L5